MTTDKKKTEYEAGRINFEENLRKSLERAHEEYAKGNFVKMCFRLQDVWRQAWEKDRRAIIKAIKKRAGQDYDDIETRGRLEGRHIDKGTFLSLITSSRNYAVHRTNYEPQYHENDWLDILTTMTEAIYREYLGKQRHWEERHEEA